jgi:hypothetical protein
MGLPAVTAGNVLLLQCSVDKLTAVKQQVVNATLSPQQQQQQLQGLCKVVCASLPAVHLQLCVRLAVPKREASEQRRHLLIGNLLLLMQTLGLLQQQGAHTCVCKPETWSDMSPGAARGGS